MCAQGTLSSTIVLQAGGGFFAFVFFHKFQQAKMSSASKMFLG